MSRWYRAYAGMVRDDKLVRAALKSRQTVERVVWVWAAILESAAEIDDAGRYEIDVPEIAYFLRADESDIAGIVQCLEGLGRLHANFVAKWGDRQFQSDRSAERQKRYRDKRAGKQSDDVETLGNVTVTTASRHGDAPETETELDTTTEPNGPVVVRAQRKTKINPDWQPSESGLASALKRDLTEPEIQRETSRFVHHHTAKGNTMASWDAAWITWLDSPYRQANRPHAPPGTAPRNNRSLIDGLDEIERRFPDEQPSYPRLAG